VSGRIAQLAYPIMVSFRAVALQFERYLQIALGSSSFSAFS
jgi:hypothetical protein